MKTWTYASKSSPDTTYTVTHADNGLLGCDCRGWKMKKPGKPRECSHITDVIAKNGLVREIRNDYVFAANNSENNPKEIVKNSPSSLTQSAVDSIITVLGKTDTQEMMMATTMTMTTTPAGNVPAAQLASGMTVPVSGAEFNAKYGDGNWTMDEKLDGHRMIVVRRDNHVSGWSSARSGGKANQKNLPSHLEAELMQLPNGIYDGEFMVPGGNSWNVTDLRLQSQLTFIAFDVIELFGESTCQLPSSTRRELLLQAVNHVQPATAVFAVAEFEPTWANVEAIWQRGGEGAILKKKSSTYRPGYRTDAWVKVKQLMSVVGVVTGFKAGSFGPYSVTCLTLDSGVKTQVKTLDSVTINEISAAPEKYIGRRLVLQCQQITPGSGAPRHPMFDHWAGDGE